MQNYYLVEGCVLFEFDSTIKNKLRHQNRWKAWMRFQKLCILPHSLKIVFLLYAR